MDSEDEFTFECPVCSESLEVNDPMKQALINNGCVICGAGVTSNAFTPLSSH